MLKSALKTTLATELDDPSNTDILSLLGDFIDEAIETIAIRFKWNYLNIVKETKLFSGQQTITVPGIIDIEKIGRKDTNEEIPKSTRGYLTSLGVNFQDTGFPSWWFVDSFVDNVLSTGIAGFVIKFDKEADKDYELLLTCKKELGGIDDGDHIPFPINMIPIIKHYVRSAWFLNEENRANADRYESRFERNLLEYIRNYGRLSAERVKSAQNSDLHFATPMHTYDINLDKDRIIVEP